MPLVTKAPRRLVARGRNERASVMHRRPPVTRATVYETFCKNGPRGRRDRTRRGASRPRACVAVLALLLVACASSACRDRAEEPAATATVAATAAAPAAAATAITTAISPATAPGASAEDGERPYSVQLHVHGS